MWLHLLFWDKCFHIDILWLDLVAEQLMGLIDWLVDEWVLKHSTGGKFDEKVSGHIIGQVSHAESSLPSLFHWWALDLDEVEVPVDIHFASLIVKHMNWGYELTVTLVEVEERLKIIDIGRR